MHRWEQSSLAGNTKASAKIATFESLLTRAVKMKEMISHPLEENDDITDLMFNLQFLRSVSCFLSLVVRFLFLFSSLIFRRVSITVDYISLNSVYVHDSVLLLLRTFCYAPSCFRVWVVCCQHIKRKLDRWTLLFCDAVHFCLVTIRLVPWKIAAHHVFLSPHRSVTSCLHSLPFKYVHIVFCPVYGVRISFIHVYVDGKNCCELFLLAICTEFRFC